MNHLNRIFIGGIFLTKALVCKACKKEIKDKDELVTVNHYLQVIPLHHDCFDKDDRGVMATLFSNHRLNGWTGYCSFIIMVIIGFVLFFTIDHFIRYIPLCFIILEIYYRIISYFKYERYFTNHISNNNHV